MGQSALQPSRLPRGRMSRAEMETTVAGEPFGAVQPSLLANAHVAFLAHGASYTRVSSSTQNPGHESGAEPFPRVTQDLIYVGSASSEVWLGNEKRLRGKERELEGGRKPGL